RHFSFGDRCLSLSYRGMAIANESSISKGCPTGVRKQSFPVVEDDDLTHSRLSHICQLMRLVH
ncbi:MAG: hypothetical protein AAFQ23_15400, partial [Cyanobacteria bacterium J06623_1]